MKLRHRVSSVVFLCCLLAGSASAEAQRKIHFTSDLSSLAAADQERVAALLAGDAALWAPDPGSQLVTVLGAESGGEESELSLEMGLFDGETRGWVEPYLARLDEFETWLPLPEGLPAAALEPKLDSLVIADAVWRSGAKAGSDSMSSFLPRDRSRAAMTGRTHVFWRNLLEHRWYDLEIVPTAALIFEVEERHYATAAAHLRFFATRFTTYQLGPQSAEVGRAQGEARVGLREHFSDLYGPLVIAKADLLGVLAHEWLIAEGLETPETSRENLAMLVLMAFRALADVELGEAPPPHEPASLLQLNYFRQQGALEYDAATQRWRFDAAKLRAAARELVGEIFAIHATGDVERGRRLLTRHGERGAEISATLERLEDLGTPRVEVSFEVIGLGAPATDPDRRMVLTFDDLPAQRAQRLPEARIHEILGSLSALLERREIPAIGFVNENKLESDGAVDAGRVALLERWLDAGLALGNHTYSHPDLHRVDLEAFKRDVVSGERTARPLVESRGGEWRYFRHPFLHSGRDLATKHGLERFLAGRGQEVAPVTIDNSEWIFARAYDEALDRGDAELQERLGKAYVDYMERMTIYYEGQSRALFEREIPQVLLLHANAINAHHIEALLERLRARGYRFIGLGEALADPAYASPDTYTGPGGITWLHRWAITRGVDRKMFHGEPTTPVWVQDVAGIRE